MLKTKLRTAVKHLKLWVIYCLNTSLVCGLTHLNMHLYYKGNKQIQNGRLCQKANIELKTTTYLILIQFKLYYKMRAELFDTTIIICSLKSLHTQLWWIFINIMANVNEVVMFSSLHQPLPKWNLSNRTCLKFAAAITGIPENRCEQRTYVIAYYHCNKYIPKAGDSFAI